MSTEHPGIIEGWLEPSGICHYVPDSHCQWASRYFKIPLPPVKKNQGFDFMKAGMALDKTLFERGWVKIHIQESKNLIYFMTFNTGWQKLTHRQRSWIYEMAIFEHTIRNEKVMPDVEVRATPMKIQFGNTNNYLSPDDLKEEKVPMFGKLMNQVIYERATFGQLYAGSESGRKERGAHDVNARSTQVTSTDNGEAWTFNYKSNPSTTNNRWHGFIQFFKEDVSGKENASDLECKVDCDCPDYRYRYSYNNKQADVGWTGKHPEWKYSNDNNGQKWKPRSQGGVGDYGVGLCKHLCALKEFLHTVIEPNAPNPEDEVQPSAKIKEPQKPLPKTTTTVQAPKPGDTYSDSRTGSDTLQEGQHSQLYGRIDNFVKTTPQFNVMM